MTLDHHHTGMSPSFCHWQELTDLYARQLDDLQRGAPGASVALSLTLRELETCRLEVQAKGPIGWH